MKIAVIGCGFVGSTVADFLESHLVQVHRIDPKYHNTTVFDVRETCEAFVICVPTPEGKDGVCDDQAVRQVINQLDTDKPILLKSTVTPDLMQDYPDNVAYNPEFLRANSAKEDFQKQELFILGSKDENHMDFWSKLFMPFLHNTVEKRMSRTEAAMVKYTHNAWLATKVAFFHELFLSTKDMQDFNYSTITSALGYMKNIGPSHMMVSDDNETLGYGGHCFPKDVKALTNTIEHSILEQVISTNKRLNKRSIK
jgi:UDPglucose 6-dehydrogenase